MRKIITLMAAVTLASPSAYSADPQRFQPKRECLAYNPDGSCIVPRVDPYGPNLFMAQQHYACLAECDNTYEFCLMSYVQSPSPVEYCRHVHAVCLQSCP